MKVNGNHPLGELLSKKLFSIENVPKPVQIKMVNTAIKAAVKWHNDEIKQVNIIDVNRTNEQFNSLFNAKGNCINAFDDYFDDEGDCIHEELIDLMYSTYPVDSDVVIMHYVSECSSCTKGNYSSQDLFLRLT